MLPSLQIKIGANTQAAIKGLEGVRRKLSTIGKTVGNASRGLQNFGSAATNAGGALAPVSGAVAGVAGGLFALVNSSANAAVEIERMSQRANAAPEQFQRMAAAAKKVGFEQDELADVLMDFNDRVGDFITTGAGPMVDFFEQIGPKVGVTIEDFKKLSGPEALQLYVSSLEKAGVSQQEMTFYMEAMSGNATKLLPLLRNNGEEMQRLGDRAAEMGLIFDSQAIDKSKKFKDQMAILSASMQALGMALADELLPIFINDFIPFLINQVVPALQQVAQFVGNSVQAFNELSPPVKQAAAIIAAVFAAGGPALVALGVVATAIGALLSPIGLVVAAVAGLSAIWITYGDDIKKFYNDTLKPFIADFIDGYVKLKDEVSQAMTDLDAWWREKWNGLLEFLGDIPGNMWQLGLDIVDGLLKGIEEKWQELKDLIYELGDVLPEWLKKRLGIASPSKVFAEIGGQAVDGLREGIQSEAPSLRDVMSRLGGIMENSLTSAFDGLIDGTFNFRQAFAEMVNSLIKEAFRLLVIEQIMAQIKNAFGGGSFFGASTAGLFSSFEGGGYTGGGARSGGVDGRGGFPAILHPNETVIDHTKGGAVGGVTVVQNNHFASGVTRSEVSALLPKMIQATKASILDSQQRSVSGRAFI